MTMPEVLAYARRKMAEHGLLESGWTAETFRARRTRGQCRPQRKTIRISTHLIEQAPVESIKDTVLHEIAHAICWERYRAGGHGSRWKEVARTLGARPLSCAPMDYAEAGYRWIIRCLDCNDVEIGRYQKSTLVKSILQEEGRYLCPGCRSHRMQARRVDENFAG